MFGKSFFTNFKTGVINPDVRFGFLYDKDCIKIEIRLKDTLVSVLDFPYSVSGLNYANRVFNQLE